MTTEPSGVDLARQALLAARETARKNGGATAKKPKRRTTTAVRRDGREPLGLGSAISRMMTERGMTAPAAGGSVLADFDTILAAVVPELAGRVKAVAFDAEPGRLDLVPDLPAAGTQLRWSAPKLITAANEKVAGANVRTLHVLAPAPAKAGPATAAAVAGLQPTAPAAPRQPAEPPECYREAIAAHRTTRTWQQHTTITTTPAYWGGLDVRSGASRKRSRNLALPTKGEQSQGAITSAEAEFADATVSSSMPLSLR